MRWRFHCVPPDVKRRCVLLLFDRGKSRSVRGLVSDASACSQRLAGPFSRLRTPDDANVAVMRKIRPRCSAAGFHAGMRCPHPLAPVPALRASHLFGCSGSATGRLPRGSTACPFRAAMRVSNSHGLRSMRKHAKLALAAPFAVTRSILWFQIRSRMRKHRHFHGIRSIHPVRDRPTRQ
jgi:hypothetical protein